jgi:hypothetical protein
VNRPAHAPRGLTFVVGTGRCGSTMLSRILHLHPEVLSVSEFLSTLMRVMNGRELPVGDLDGGQLWDMLSAPDPVFDALLVAGLGYPELCYPYGSGRFAAATGVPRICHMTLPALTDDPDALFDRLAVEVPSWPRRPAARQYLALFEFLAGILNRRVIVERSGASLSMLAVLREMFPEARFIHMHRNGPDCALSMSRHPGFRMAGLAAAARRLAGTSSWAQIQAAPPPGFDGVLVPPFDAARFREYPIEPAFFGQLWSRTVRDGLKSLRALPAAAWTDLRYEDLIGDPGTELTRVASYIGVEATPQWLDAAAGIIGERRGAPSRPDPATMESLRAACLPGTEAIASLAPMP